MADLEARYLEECERRRVAVTSAEATLEVERVLPVGQAAAWELLTAPGKRPLSRVDGAGERHPRPDQPRVGRDSGR